MVTSNAFVIFNAFQALINTDTMKLVDDVVTNVQVRVRKYLFFGSGSNLFFSRVAAFESALRFVSAARKRNTDETKRGTL